jgi:hypothetical protein
MSTYQTRVEDRVGTISDTAALSDFLTAGAKYITNLLPAERLEKFTTNLTDAGSGISVTAHKVLSANKSSYGARKVPNTMAAQVANSSSIHYAGTTDPVYYILNGSAYVKPSGGTVVAMAYPTVAYGDSTITAFPSDLDEGVVLYASIQARLRQLTDLAMTTINGLSFVNQVPPAPPSAPSFTYAAATYTDAEYTSAVYVDALIDTVASTGITFTDTLSYTPPVFSGSFTNTDTALTNQDIELANAHLNKIQTQLEEMQKGLSNSAGEFAKDKAVFDTDFQKAVQEAQLTQQRLIQQSQMQIELNKFNSQQALQTAISNGNQEMQLDITNQSKATEVMIINATKELERQVQEYQSTLAKYGQEMNAYSTGIQQEVSRFSARLNQYGQQSQIMLAELQALRNEFNEYIKAI